MGFKAYVKRTLPGPLPIPDGLNQINGFPFYCVSMDGEVWSCRSRGGVFVPWRKMRPGITKPNKDGRLQVTLRRDNQSTTHPVHILILETFIGPCPAGLEGCHNDGNGLNNRVDNLRWDTHQSNMEDRVKHGTAPIGERNPAAILTEQQVREIRALYAQGKQQKQIAPMFGVSKQCIQVACAGETWKNVQEVPA